MREALRSASDEHRHAATMRRLARREGASDARPPPAPRRSPMALVDLAIANVTEGASASSTPPSLATWTAKHARAPEHRTSFRRIARDETRHAAFALELARDLDLRLDDGERSRVRSARVEAEQALRSSLARCAALHERGLQPPLEVQRAAVDFVVARWSVA